MIVSWRRSEVQKRLSKDSVDCNNGLQSYCFLNREAVLLFYEQSFLTHLCVCFFFQRKKCYYQIWIKSSYHMILQF